ncbi:class I SAM-dependent methyltransferase [Nitrosomonas sp.]|uniref:class I SAM-dependent methyltransferase n=1 Tax=Nitrosomonas sp. TaxID=42353 RepID=UPI001D3F891D|nr:methyltransferase domain-containing protein [Nitrosomonas sp.]MBX3616256.1 methyltransferase domain-containing protein [Nitrosomonas sp.]
MATNQKTSFIIEGAGNLLARFRTSSRQRRAKMFLNNFDLTSETKILDLGGWNGVHIHAVLENSPVQPANVYIADIDEQAVKQAAENFGFTPVVIPETGSLPFPDKFFDIVFCSSVIEHVTVPKDSVWTLVSGRIFREEAQRHQNEFAGEIVRLGNGYFVQAPYRWFPIETHSWLPFISYLPRRLQVPLLRFTNRYWVKQTSPDFYLPTRGDMQRYFPDANILEERVLGLTKSLIAYHRN